MSNAPLFDSYLMVDWSAANQPARGKDSIWWCHMRRHGSAMRTLAVENVATRHEARRRLLALLEAEHGARRAVLAGFDFAFGYPSGLAERLQLPDPPWRSLWDLLAAAVKDEPDNSNNRFAVAAALNERISGGPAPFWGCPASAVHPCLDRRHHRRHAELGLAERRLADERIRGPQPVWKLAYPGSVGSQVLTGIPVLSHLRDHGALAAATRIWPFETGLRPLARGDTEGRIVLAEIYPSLVRPQPRAGEVRDAGQVRAIARHFAVLDAAGELAALFAGDPTLSDEERRRVEREESWILGVSGGAEDRGRRYRYLRDPDDIYRESFARIRAETDLSPLPTELRALALRLVHAVGEPAILRDLVWSAGAIGAGEAALADGAPILVDARMVAAGITVRRLPKENPVHCFLDDQRVPALAQRLGTTRSAAAVELWRPHLAGAVVAIGNAPTALFHLLEMIEAGAPKPALVLGFPVGFVGASEAKAALAENRNGVPFVALSGRRGGSALAAAAVNALAAGEEAQ